MFENLTDRLSKTLKSITGQAKLSEENIKETLREIKRALLEADVALEVVNHFVSHIKDKAVGLEVDSKLSPGQFLVKLVKDELITVMGEKNEALSLNAAPPAVVLMAGLQGSGKTTSVGKLARWLKENEKKKVLVTSCDIYRPAAIDQLETVAKAVGVEFAPSQSTEKPVDIAKRAIAYAKQHQFDVVMVDTAGRLHIDDDMMSEIKALHAAINPVETLFVVDSMTGQDAAKTAKAFDEALPLTGVVLTKTDGDARGGAALSIRQLTGKPIKFMGIGEKLDALEAFHPDRVASRILGMGDVLTLIEEIEKKVDKKKADKIAKKIQKGKGFDLEDYREQLQQMQTMGGLSSMMNKLPGMGNLPQAAKEQVNDKVLLQAVAMINSMTPKERRYPALIKGSRKKRIALGSGTQIQDVNRLLKQHQQMQKMMKKFSSKGGMTRMMRGLQGKLPPGVFPQ